MNVYSSVLLNFCPETDRENSIVDAFSREIETMAQKLAERDARIAAMGSENAELRRFECKPDCKLLGQIKAKLAAWEPVMVACGQALVMSDGIRRAMADVPIAMRPKMPSSGRVRPSEAVIPPKLDTAEEFAERILDAMGELSGRDYAHLIEQRDLALRQNERERLRARVIARKASFGTRASAKRLAEWQWMLDVLAGPEGEASE